MIKFNIKQNIYYNNRKLDQIQKDNNEKLIILDEQLITMSNAIDSLRYNVQIESRLSEIHVSSEDLLSCLPRDLSIQQQIQRQKIMRQKNNEKLSNDEKKIKADKVNQIYALMSDVEKTLLLRKRKVAFQNLSAEQHRIKKIQEMLRINNF